MGFIKRHVQCVSGSLSSVVKRSGREADHAFLSSAEVAVRQVPHMVMACTETRLPLPLFSVLN